MFSAIGRLTHRRRGRVVLVWLALLVVGTALSGRAQNGLATDFDSSPRLESVKVAERLDAIDPRGEEIVAVIDGWSISDGRLRAGIEAAKADVGAVPGVLGVVDYWSTADPALVSTDGRATVVAAVLAPGLEEDAARDSAHAVAERLRQIEAPVVKVGGAALLHQEFHEAVENDLKRGETTALPIALIAMVVIFGGLLAAGLPLIIAFLAVSGAMIVLVIATSVMDVSVFALNVIYMLGIGLGIDYGLLMVSRFREERAAGSDVSDAVARTVQTAGRTVAFSALTVAVALSGLFAFDNPTFRSFGVAGIGVVLVAMGAAVTLLPALLGIFGRRIKPAKVRAADSGYFSRLASLVQRHAVPVVVLIGFVLAALAVPFLSARFEMGDARSLPRSSEARAVAVLLGDRFPARGADPILVLAEADQADPAVGTYVEGLKRLQGVAAVAVRQHTTPGTVVIEVVPSGATQGETAQSLVRALRSGAAPFPVQVGGPAAFLLDTKASIAQSLPLALAIIAVATFVLLFLMTGSVAVPAKAIVMNVLSLGASFGGLVWVFQDGHLSGLLGFDPVGSVDLFMPVLIFIFAFGLSMDYEVFLLARIKELYDHNGDNDAAVAVGLQRTGRIITSAALLIVVVFAGFAAGEVLMIKQLGFGLALAVIVDATIVRSLLVPATMKLLGDRNWWAPAPLRRLHARYGVSDTPALPPNRELQQLPA